MNVLECRDLTKKYGSTQALKGINLTLESGKIVGLLGPNGSGKTTLIKIANRLLQPTSGEILICGQKPGVRSKALVSYLPDREYLPTWMKIPQILNFYQDFYKDFDREKAEKLLKDLKIDQGRTLKQLSKGTNEKVRLILTMSRHAKLYLLDEPIAGVDPAARDYIIDMIIRNFDRDSLIFISTHLIADIESILDEAVFIREGEIVLHESTDHIRSEHGKSVDEYFREVFR